MKGSCRKHFQPIRHLNANYIKLKLISNTVLALNLSCIYFITILKKWNLRKFELYYTFLSCDKINDAKMIKNVVKFYKYFC